MNHISYLATSLCSTARIIRHELAYRSLSKNRFAMCLPDIFFARHVVRYGHPRSPANLG
ncbi:tbc1 domain family member 14, partial [Moniliophthora roreri]